MVESGSESKPFGSRLLAFTPFPTHIQHHTGWDMLDPKAAWALPSKVDTGLGLISATLTAAPSQGLAGAQATTTRTES